MGNCGKSHTSCGSMNKMSFCFHITCVYVWICILLYTLYIFILHVYGPFCSYRSVQFITKASGKKKIFVFWCFFFFFFFG